MFFFSVRMLYIYIYIHFFVFVLHHVVSQPRSALSDTAVFFLLIVIRKFVYLWRVTPPSDAEVCCWCS